MSRPDRRALFIAPAVPSLTGNGLAIRLGVFAEALSKVADTDLLLLPVFGGDGDSGLIVAFGIPVATVPLAGRGDTQYRLLSQLHDPAPRLAAFRRYGRGSTEAKISAAVLDDVRRYAAARRYDLVHVGRSYLMAAGIAAAADAVLTVDLDEDDAWSWRSFAKLRTGPESAAWAAAEADAADATLRRLHSRFAALFISGPADRRRMSARHPGLNMTVAANPAPATAGAVGRHDDGKTLLFVGSFGYEPNVDGLVWFADAVWPSILAARPDTRLRIVGRGLSAQLATRLQRPGIDIAGAVDDLAPHYAAATLALAPLRAGAGTRIKLIEAAAFGVPIVSTPIGARGLSFGTARGMWLGETAARFAAATVEALGDPGERKRRAAHAHSAVRRNHERARIVDRLACQFSQLLAR